jgi:type VI secretion system protein ImpF
MARVDPRKPLQPSVLDRLLDDEPDRRKEAARPPSQGLRQLRRAMRRDLQNLLNTRQPAVEVPRELAELERSIADFGIPDITGTNLASDDARRRLLRSIEGAIRRFEPRFKSVKVTAVEDPDQIDRVLRFRINGVVYADPLPEAVVFDSTVEPVSRTFEVEV